MITVVLLITVESLVTSWKFCDELKVLWPVERLVPSWNNDTIYIVVFIWIESTDHDGYITIVVPTITSRIWPTKLNLSMSLSTWRAGSEYKSKAIKINRSFKGSSFYSVFVSYVVLYLLLFFFPLFFVFCITFNFVFLLIIVIVTLRSSPFFINHVGKWRLLSWCIHIPTASFVRHFIIH